MSIVRRTKISRRRKSSITAKKFPTLSSIFDTATTAKPSSLDLSSMVSGYGEKKADPEAEKYEAATFAYLYLCEQDMHIPNTKNLDSANAVGQDWTVSEWVIEWMSEWVSEWVDELVSERMGDPCNCHFVTIYAAFGLLLC